ncbi:Alpha/Beta hydrolase protein [Globomyces pollinis-pini]|nr:Alpha/Beta hydrolase protein [Globomyces pollinis-pini]
MDTSIHLGNTHSATHASHHEKISPFVSRSTKVTTTSTGKKQEWNVFTHSAFPKYSIRTKEDSKLCDPSVKQITGYLDVDDEKHFFFWFFESKSKPKTDPLVLWLNGGPGCSSLTGLLMEHGPCRPTAGGADTVPDPSSWNTDANIIYLDQPVNVGFSYSEGSSPTNSDDVGVDVHAFLQVFVQAYPKYAALPFHVTGESYAGHYIPAIAKVILDANSLMKNDKTPKLLSDEGIGFINLTSIAIGNGLTDPLTQYEYYPDMACDTKYGPILPEETCDEMRGKYNTCKSLISACYQYKTPFTCVPGSFYCNSAMIQPFQSTGLNIYDIRKKCDPSNPLCYDILNDIEAYLNRADVQEELGVDVQYEGCKRNINMNFLLAGDWMHPYVEYVPYILESGVKVLIYAGDADFICNHIGNKAWVLALEWEGQEAFNAAEDWKWTSKITKREAGEFRMAGNLAYLRVYEAGHMVPYDQPEHSLEFFSMWIHGHKK